MSFLMHFQLPIRYETGTELLTSLCQTNYVHVSDHIHEWRRRRRLIKAIIPNQLLAEWFTKSLLPPIARDIAMGGVVIEEESIARAQYLDLVYSKSGTLHDLIPNATCATTDPSKPSSSSHADGVISDVKTQSTSQSTEIVNLSASAPSPSSTSLFSTSLPTQVSKVNAVQSSPSQQSGGNKKTKNKYKNNNTNEQPKSQTPPPATENQPQQKLKLPCLICGDDHYTQYCRHRDEVEKNFKGNSQPVVLTHPFPWKQYMLSQTPSPRVNSSHPPNDEASTSAHIYMFSGIDLTTLSTTDNMPVKPDKEKVSNGSLSDPSPATVSSPSVIPPYGSLYREKPTFDSILHPPKSTIRKSTFNPSS
jgi:hypothetical protein